MTCDYEPKDDAERAVIVNMLSVASKYSIESEVVWEYKAHRENGREPYEAAAFALHAWDL